MSLEIHRKYRAYLNMTLNNKGYVYFDEPSSFTLSVYCRGNVAHLQHDLINLKLIVEYEE